MKVSIFYQRTRKSRYQTVKTFKTFVDYPQKLSMSMKIQNAINQQEK